MFRMLDVYVKLACVMCLYVTRRDPITIMYTNYLCDYCMCYVFIFLYVYMYTGKGPMPDKSIYLAGLDVRWGLMPGGAHYMFDMYGMWNFGELTKLCAYCFMVMVSGTFDSKWKGPS